MSTRRGRGSSAAGLFRILFAAGILTAAPADGAPPVLLSIRFSGNVSIPSGDLRAAVALAKGDVLDESAIGLAITAVTSLYRARSFYAAAATPSLEYPAPDSSAADLRIVVSEGLRATFGRAEFRGVSALPAELADEAFALPAGEPFSEGALAAGLSRLLAEYERSGRPFARASVGGIDDGGGGAMTVTVDVIEGALAVVDGIRVEGNAETDPAVILREARMDLPGPYDPAAASRFAARLRRMGIFSVVEEPALASTGGGYSLLVRLREGRTGTFDGIVGYAPDPAGGSGIVTGGASIGFRNLFGTARRLEAGWSRAGRGTEEIRLAGEEPWVFGLPVNLGAGFAQRRQDSSWVEMRLRASAEFLATASLSVAAVGERHEVIPSGGPAGAGVPGGASTTGGVTVRYDTRDDREFPRGGVEYRSEYRTGRRSPSGPGGAAGAVRHIGFDLDVFVPFGRRQVLDLGLHGREIATDSPGPGELYRLGGFRTLRGFREDRFSGERVAWGTVEYRFLAGGKSFLYGFLDPGYVGSGSDDLFTYGYGIGMRLETGLGMIGVSFALGEGDPVADTKIHFGLINDF